jgi:hypothetical protein
MVVEADLAQGCAKRTSSTGAIIIVSEATAGGASSPCTARFIETARFKVDNQHRPVHAG